MMFPLVSCPEVCDNATRQQLKCSGNFERTENKYGSLAVLTQRLWLSVCINDVKEWQCPKENTLQGHLKQQVDEMLLSHESLSDGFLCRHLCMSSAEEMLPASCP